MANIDLTLRREKGAHLTIDEVDANFTKLRDGIIAEEQARIDLVEVTTEDLTASINDEQSARIAADLALESSIVSEATTRQTIDIALDNKINTEITNRVALGTNLDNKINTEITNRVALGNDLHTNYFNKTECDSRYFNIAGDALTGDILFGNRTSDSIYPAISYGLKWNNNTDYATVSFLSTGDGVNSDGSGQSNVSVFLGDNGNEGFSIFSYNGASPGSGLGDEVFYVNKNVLRYNGNKIWNEGNTKDGRNFKFNSPGINVLANSYRVLSESDFGHLIYAFGSGANTCNVIFPNPYSITSGSSITIINVGSDTCTLTFQGFNGTTNSGLTDLGKTKESGVSVYTLYPKESVVITANFAFYAITDKSLGTLHAGGDILWSEGDICAGGPGLYFAGNNFLGANTPKAYGQFGGVGGFSPDYTYGAYNLFYTGSYRYARGQYKIKFRYDLSEYSRVFVSTNGQGKSSDGSTSIGLHASAQVVRSWFNPNDVYVWVELKDSFGNFVDLSDIWGICYIIVI